MAELPASAFTADWRQLNCVNFIARDANGTVLARAFALIQFHPNGSTLILR